MVIILCVGTLNLAIRLSFYDIIEVDFCDYYVFKFISCTGRACQLLVYHSLLEKAVGMDHYLRVLVNGVAGNLLHVLLSVL